MINQNIEEENQQKIEFVEKVIIKKVDLFEPEERKENKDDITKFD